MRCAPRRRAGGDPGDVGRTERGRGPRAKLQCSEHLQATGPDRRYLGADEPASTVVQRPVASAREAWVKDPDFQPRAFPSISCVHDTCTSPGRATSGSVARGVRGCPGVSRGGRGGPGGPGCPYPCEPRATFAPPGSGLTLPGLEPRLRFAGHPYQVCFQEWVAFTRDSLGVGSSLTSWSSSWAAGRGR